MVPVEFKKDETVKTVTVTTLVDTEAEATEVMQNIFGLIYTRKGRCK